MQANTLDIGTGIYTLKDAELLLDIPMHRMSRWLNTYWNNRFATETLYTRKESGTRYFNFYTLIELNVVSQMREMGLTFKEIEKAHQTLSKNFGSPFPFAHHDLYYNKNWIYILTEQGIAKADDTLQFGFQDLIKPYAHRIDFDEREKLAKALFLNDAKDIVAQPDIQFGEPVIAGTRIKALDIYSYFKAGETIKSLAEDFHVTENQIKHAIDLYKDAA
ncbi:DUF433 domain-containing protein [bacterium]|nr:MAG: DUF433 domain-containing protein [bacterium]